MFSQIRSRSQSREKLKSLENKDIKEEDDDPQQEPQPGRATPESAHWDNMGLDHAYDPSFAFTQGHPIGNILLKQQADITRLAEKIKLYDMTTNVNELCSSFENGIELERAKTFNTISQNNEEIEEKIISKELKAHRLDNAVEPPNNFSPVPTLVNNPNKLKECLQVFPRGNKFSGTPGSQSIIEFLTNMTLAQEQCALSEKEFLDRLLAACTGRAHELILMWIQNQSTAANIYMNLLIHYDKRPNIDEAKRMLFSYKVQKHENLAVAEGKIMCWVALAAKTVPVGPSRNTYSDLESCQTLIRALPEWSSMSVENLYKSLSAKFGRALTFNELDQALNTLRPNIDRDIKKNGVENTKKFGMNKFNKNRTNVTTRAHQVLNLDARPNVDTVGQKKFPPQRSRTETSFTPKPIFRNRAPVRAAYTPRTGIRNNNNYNNRSGQTNSRPIRNNRGARRGNKTFNQRTPFKGNNAMPNCILCGFRNHKAEQCRNMKDDKGNIKKVLPQFGKCSACPEHIQPRLNHPQALCPFRPLGPLHKSN